MYLREERSEISSYGVHLYICATHHEDDKGKTQGNVARAASDLGGYEITLNIEED